MVSSNENNQIKNAILFARNFGQKRGLSFEQSEDLAQRWVIKKYVERTGQTLEQAYVDFLRFEFGDTRNNSGAIKSEARRTYKDIDRGFETRTYSHGDFDRFSRGFDRSNKRRKQLKLISLKESFVLSELSKGKSITDIANRLGVTDARISQIKKQIADKMRIVNIEKPLCIDWITL